MPADIRDLPREEFIEKNLAWSMPAPGASRGGGSSTRSCMPQGAWGWSRPAMVLIQGGASAFPPMPCR